MEAGVKWLLGTVCIAVTLVKIQVLGINGAGALTIGQLFLTYGLDRWRAHRDIQKDPYLISYDEDGRLVWTPKETEGTR